METAASRLSSFWGNRRVRVALGGLVLVVLGAASVVVYLRGDNEGDARREAVSAYIARVNTTQQALILELEHVNRAYRELRLAAAGDPKELARVEEAERTLRRLQSRLADVPAPAEAQRLRAALLQLARLQVELAAEVAGMARYIPVQAEQGRAVGAATAALRTRLTRAETDAAQRETFAEYEAALRGAVERLEATPAPRVLRPARTRELRRLRELAELADRLGVAIAAQRAADVDRLFRRFLVVNASTGTTRAERDAVVEYNRRVAEIAEQQETVSLERTRLDVALR